MWEFLMFLSFLAGVLSLLIVAYRFIKKKRKKPFVLSFIVSFIIFFIAGSVYNSNLAPEQRAINQQKAEQQKSAQTEKESTEKSQVVPDPVQEPADSPDAKIVAEIEKICKNQLGDKFIQVEVRDNASQPGTKIVVPHFKGNEGWDNEGARKAMILQTRDLFNKLFNSGLPISKSVAMIQGNLIDKYGNESNSNVMKCTLTDATAAKINWKNIKQIDFKTVLDDVWVHPALRKNG